MNLRGGKTALDLLQQTAREREVDILFISEQYKKAESATWYQDKSRRAAIWLCKPDLRVSDSYSSDKGYVWIEYKGTRMYSCYYSPNDTIQKFQEELETLERSIQSAKGPVLITGDFNGKSPEWGETRLDKRGNAICEFVARNDLTVMNNGQEHTFRRGDTGSIIDLTIASENLASKIENWRVLEEITLSDHQYITFDVKIQKSGQIRKRRNRRKFWNVRKLDKAKLRDQLAETKIMDDFGWLKQNDNADQVVQRTKKKIVAACDAAMPQRKENKKKSTCMYWWNSELQRLKKLSLVARRRYTKSKGNEELKNKWHEDRESYKKAIVVSKRHCWIDLINEVEKEPWGLV